MKFTLSRKKGDNRALLSNLRDAKADVVITDNYAFLGKQVFIQVKALDVSRTHTIVSTSVIGVADKSLFTMIGKIANETSIANLKLQ